MAITTTPAEYGAYCGTDLAGPVVTQGCGDAIKTMCANLQLTEFPKAAWTWVDPGAGCSIGVYMPNPDAATKLPSQAECEDNIYAAMQNLCFPAASTNTVASVNLSNLPSFSDATQTGVAVNAALLSYVIAAKAPTGLNQAWCGWTTATGVGSVPGRVANLLGGPIGT